MMMQRCYNPNNNSFKNYGARGIRVCDRWRHSFADFAADVGPRPHGASLDRVNNNGDYEPDNVRWATRVEQMNNTRLTRKDRVRLAKSAAMKRWHPERHTGRLQM